MGTRVRMPDGVQELPLGRPRRTTFITCGVCGERRPNKGRGLCAEHYQAEYKAGRIEQWRLDRARKMGVRVQKAEGRRQRADDLGPVEQALAERMIEVGQALIVLGHALKEAC